MWGILNAVAITIPVYVINMGEFGQYAAVTKQALYAFFIGSHMVRVARHTALWVINHHILHNRWAVWFGVLVAGTLNTILNTILHTFKGTPDPQTTVFFVSALSFMALILSGYIEVHYLHKNKTADQV